MNILTEYNALKYFILWLETFQFFVLQLEENRALKCEIENFKNDLQESRHNLEVANEKLDSYTNCTEKAKASSEQLMNEELQRLKDINCSQKEEISTVCGGKYCVRGIQILFIFDH